MSSSTIDLNQPLSDILRQTTKEVHEKIEHSPAATKLLNGELSREEYVQFLMMLWHVYSALEEGLERYASHPVLEPIYNPALLHRAPALSSDIAQLLQVSESAWPAHPLHRALVASPPKAMSVYVDRIQAISSSADPSPLVAHAYVRYLGDLSGGQTIRHTLAKAYNLDEAAGEGLSFYAFKELQSAKPANLGEMKKIKDWFRAGMNEGAGDNVAVKDAIAKEATIVFYYNGDLFNAIIERQKDLPAAHVHEAPFGGGRTVSSVLAVITAVTLVHFVFIVSGRYTKVGTADHWFKLGSLWH